MQSGVLLDLDTLAESDLDLSELKAVVPQWRMYPGTVAEEVDHRIADAELVLTNKVVLKRENLVQAKRLKLICILATGTNNVDLQAARELGISVCNVTAYATDSVAQHVMALILAHHTRLLQYTQAVQNGDWCRSRQFCLLDYPVRELRDLSLGVIGYGDLGQGVARLARAFGMQVLIGRRPGGEVQAGRLHVDELVSRADIITLHVPLAENTHHLIDARRLALMPSHALLVNTARGAVVDNQALAHALRSGQIGGAALDVLDQEPPPADHPLLAADLPNLIITPHTAWAGRKARQRVIDQSLDNILFALYSR